MDPDVGGEEFIQVEQVYRRSVSIAEQSQDLVVVGAARGDHQEFSGDGRAFHLVNQ